MIVVNEDGMPLQGGTRAEGERQEVFALFLTSDEFGHFAGREVFLQCLPHGRNTVEVTSAGGLTASAVIEMDTTDPNDLWVEGTVELQ